MEKHTGSTYDEIARKYADEQDNKPWTIYFERPLSKTSRDLFESGFVIEEIGEPQPIKPLDDVVFNAYERTMKKPTRLMVRACKK